LWLQSVNSLKFISANKNNASILSSCHALEGNQTRGLSFSFIPESISCRMGVGKDGQLIGKVSVGLFKVVIGNIDFNS